MKVNRLVLAGAALVIAFSSFAPAQTVGSGNIKHVLLLSIDGMHAVDFYNCANGIAGVNAGAPYCPNMAALSQTGVNYVNTESSKPSDSFPGMAALASGGTPKSTGLYYDVAYDARLMLQPKPPARVSPQVHARLLPSRPEPPPTTTRGSILMTPC